MRRTDILIIGAGQAGLSVGHYLKKRELNFLIVEANKQVGHSWSNRWDSLLLFTPKSFCSLPGIAPPKHMNYLPTKDEVAKYLQEYAADSDITVELQTPINRLEKIDDEFIAKSPKDKILAKRVVVASGPFNSPRIPEFAGKLNSTVWHIHSAEYRNPSNLPQGDIIIVGCGNSGAQIATELSRTRGVTVVSDKQQLTLPQSLLGINIFWWLKIIGIMSAKKNGWWSRQIKRQGDIIIGSEFKKLLKKKKIKLLEARVVDATSNNLVLSDGRKIKATNIIWATGYKPAYDWINIQGALDPKGFPLHARGSSPVHGLFWIGLPWQTSLKSGLIYGVKNDAQSIVDELSKT